MHLCLGRTVYRALFFCPGDGNLGVPSVPWGLQGTRTPSSCSHMTGSRMVLLLYGPPYASEHDWHGNPSGFLYRGPHCKVKMATPPTKKTVRTKGGGSVGRLSLSDMIMTEEKGHHGHTALHVKEMRGSRAAGLALPTKSTDTF